MFRIHGQPDDMSALYELSDIYRPKWEYMTEEKVNEIIGRAEALSAENDVLRKKILEIDAENRDKELVAPLGLSKNVSLVDMGLSSRSLLHTFSPRRCNCSSDMRVIPCFRYAGSTVASTRPT